MQIFIDDILIMTEYESHLELVDEVLKILKVGIKIKPEKCKLFDKEVDILGHEISSNRLKKSRKFIKI